jgi:hypothetical protein
LAILFLIIVISCSNEKINKTDSSDIDSNKFIEGRITVVGNEPFTNLGLLVNDSTIYLLDCNKDLKASLLQNQGQLYKIQFNEKKETEYGTTLKVINSKKIQK